MSTARSFDGLRLRRTAHGQLRATAVARATSVAMPHPAGLHVTVGFTDMGLGPASNRCAAMTAALRPARRGGLRAP